MWEHRFAFVDFETIDQATNVLVNPKNHRLDGRTLTVEYASVEAVKRGGGSVRSMQQQKRGYPGSAGSTGPGRPDRVQRDGAQQQPRRPPSAEARPRTHPNPSSTLSHQSTASFAPPVHSPPPAPDEPVRKVKKEFKGRQKPGAALANAQRAPTGIVKNPETVGKKIVFSSFPRRLSI
jgi:RNA recognition motif-containing protein